RHPKNVTAPVLCGQYSVGTCLGTGARLSGRAACDGDYPRWRQHRATYRLDNHWADCGIGRLSVPTWSDSQIQRFAAAPLSSCGSSKLPEILHPPERAEEFS